jgi:hypothetical protein
VFAPLRSLCAVSAGTCVAGGAGEDYRVRIRFRVSHEIVSGLKFGLWVYKMKLRGEHAQRVRITQRAVIKSLRACVMAVVWQWTDRRTCWARTRRGPSRTSTSRR